MDLPKRFWLRGFLLFIFSWVFFLISVQFPRTHNFDEFHYVPSAKQFLKLTENQNWEHPPLGKLMIAAGIAAFGDRPIGWRFMSTLFGALSLLGVYVLAWLFFKKQEAALWVSLLTLFNHLLYVQARIGMLDTFMFGFLVWALVALVYSAQVERSTREIQVSWILSGTLFGLSSACKWFSWIPCLASLGLIILFFILRSIGFSFKKTSTKDWFHPRRWKNIGWKQTLLAWIILPIGTYLFTFIPVFLSTKNWQWYDIWGFQQRMYDGQLRVVNTHPYMSHPQDWPLLSRPIWYAFDKETNPAFVRGVILLGNPLIMWTGIIAIIDTFFRWIRNKNLTSFLIVFFYTLFYGSWFIIPRKIEFYYYYYPAGMMLSFALADCFFQGSHTILKKPLLRWGYLCASFGIFSYFFPILSGMRIPAEAFRRWMWFQTWI